MNFAGMQFETGLYKCQVLSFPLTSVGEFFWPASKWNSYWLTVNSDSREGTGDPNFILELIQSCLKTYLPVMNQIKMKA